VQEFHHQQISSIINELQKSEVKNGMMIWKLYDMGIIIRTEKVTVAFDITRGLSSKSEEFALSDEMMDKITDQCDLLFISHNHWDHADEVVAQMFVDKSKPVITPPDIWEGKEIYNHIIHMERKAHELQRVWLDNKKLNLDVVVYPGHQGVDLLNNVVLVFTPDGYNVCHTGDQSNRDDFSWIDEVAKKYSVDMLIPNCWTTDPLRTANGFAPQIIIPAHENELGHSIDHREAYALNYSRWDVPFSKVIMTWGESFHFNPNKK
jgi:L-ascorbate metabolism protein UlaG (beta-lactamase superfamily)